MDGVINVLKPAGITSRQVTSICKRLAGEKKVGHAGTLDPGAAGVLPVMIGKATRLFDILGEDTKEYIGEFRFGTATDTQDSYGKMVQADDKSVSQEELEAVLPLFTGEIKQQPSIYSAVHVQGKRAYEYAQAGQEVVLPTREITIHQLELLHQTGENAFLLRVCCSRGTYIRSLCVDVARALKTVGYLSFLLRTRTGRFTIESAVTLDELEQFDTKKHLTQLADVLDFLPALQVEEQFSKALYNGNKLPLHCCGQQILPQTRYRVYDHLGNLCGLGIQDEKELRIKINLRGTS